MRKRSSKGGGAQRSIQVHLMVNEEEAAMIRAAARKRNQTVSLTIIEAVKLLEGSLYVEEQMADIERRMKQLRARKQRIVARENAKARKRRTHLIIRLGGILSNEGVLGYDEGVWNDEGNRQRLLDMLKAHAAELRAWASDAGVRLPSAESAGELREQVRDLPQEPQIQEQPGYGYQPGFQQPQQWQQQPWN